MSQIKVALLPLSSSMQPYRRDFPRQIQGALVARGLEVLRLPVCCFKSEFNAAVHRAERAEVCALITLHLAYSPSLDSIAALSTTFLPVIVLATTPTLASGPGRDSAQWMYTHGIQGVQDLCNLLVRQETWFAVEAGHWQASDVLDRVVAWARGAHMARVMRASRVGRVGVSVVGSGDFQVEVTHLQATMGVNVVTGSPQTLVALLPANDAQDLAEELERDWMYFDTSKATADVHRHTVRASLAVRHWFEQEQLTAYTLNTFALTKDYGLPALPFLEASKAMQRGIGYAGEGDVLTAALVGALASVHTVTFTEMAWPDWEANRIFLSRQNEINLALADGQPRLVNKHWPFAHLPDSCIAAAALRPGPGVWVNLAPLSEGAFRLIVMPLDILADDGGRLRDRVRGWVCPRPSQAGASPIQIATLLAEYSRLGGTHHAALVYGDVARDIVAFGEIMGWDTVLL